MKHMALHRVLSAVLALLVTAPALSQTAVRGDLVYTMDGAPISDGVVLVNNGRIERVGPAGEVDIPSEYEVRDAAVVTPGLIDARNVVGLAGMYNQPSDQDQLDKSEPIQPDLRALDAYNAREDLVAWIRGLGVTTVNTGPAPGALVSGQTMIVKTAGDTVDQAAVRPGAMMAFTVGPSVSRNFDSPGTRSKGVALLRQSLSDAQAYGRKKDNADEDKEPEVDLGKEALLKVLDGEMPALVTANRAHDITTALRLAEEFGLDMILSGGAEAYLVLDEIKAAGVPVILHPTMARPSGARANAAFDTAAKLQEAGIPFAIQGGYESYVPKTRVVLFEAAVAAANGLSRSEALAAVTSSAATILGIDDRVGSLKEGKEADLVLFDGDPFEYTTHVCTVIVAGEVVSDECR